MKEKYEEINGLVLSYKMGMEAPKGSELRDKGRVAGEMLLMTFKPLILSTMTKTKGMETQDFEEAYQEGCVAFVEGLNAFDVGYGAGFGAFIKRHLQFCFWKRQRRLDKVLEEALLDGPVAGTGGLCFVDMLFDNDANTEENYVNEDTKKLEYARLKKGIEALSPIQRSIIIEHYFMGVKKSEIAKRREVSVDVVRQKHRSAILRLRKMMGSRDLV